MEKPENTVRYIRFFLLTTAILGLFGCGGSGDCDIDTDIDCVVGDQVITGQDIANVDTGNPDTSNQAAGGQNAAPVTSVDGGNSSGNNNAAPEVTPFCTAANSDPDGDGYGFENGTSCLVAGGTAVTPVTIPVITPAVNSDNITIDDINHVVVVTGQSNVEASGTAFDPVLDQPHPRVFAFTDEGWQIADLHQVWDIHAHPGNHSLTDPSRSPNNNFTFHFGKSLAQMDPSAVPAFIVLAAPGQGIAHWDFESEFYLNMRNKITTALA